MRAQHSLSALGVRHGRDAYEEGLHAVGETWAWTRDLSSAASRLDGSDLEPDEIRAWLSPLLPGDTSVLVAWPADGMGARMDYALFVRHFDDLWHPASDAVIVISSGGRLLVLDHEEQFTLLDR